MARKRRRQAGFTLTEALIASVILAVATGAILLPFTTGAAVRAEGQKKALAMSLANSLIEEILASDYDTVVASYDGYEELSGQLRDISGDLLSGEQYLNFSRKVSCQETYLDGQSGDSIPAFIKVGVQVNYDGREIANITAIKGR